MRLNKELLYAIVDALDDIVKERGYEREARFELPSGLIISLYHQYPHYFRLDIKDRYKRDLTAILILDDKEVNGDGEIE